MTAEVIALCLAVLIGLSLGAIGSGGSIVTLPILVFIAGVDPKSAVGMSMSIVGATSLFGCYFHWRHGNVALRTGLLFMAAGIPGAYIGSLGTHLISSSLLMLLFALLMFVVGTRMLRSRMPATASAVVTPARCLTVGLIVGLVTGFLGVGGGFLIVPALVWFAGLDAKHAVGTSLGIIAVNSASGIAGQMQYAHWDWYLTAKFLACSLAGMGFGIAISKSAPDRSLRKAFAVVVLVVAAGILGRVLSHW